jgi:SAM-dependent methyltransferase
VSAKEREIVKLLAKTDREERFSAIIACIRPDVFTILDLGCGIGALTTRLAEKFPSGLIVGVDRSKYLLTKLQIKKNVLRVLSNIPDVSLKRNFFDLVLAVQVLHEILCFRGVDALVKTFRNVFDLLKKDGEFIIFDYFNPGDASISLKLPEGLLGKLHEFQSKFKLRRIVYDDLGGSRIRISMRDFYDFITKVWALNSELEEEEMRETHTPFTCKELVDFVQEAGFKVISVTSLTPIDEYLEHYGVVLETEVRLPNRHVLLKAKKC